MTHRHLLARLRCVLVPVAACIALYASTPWRSLAAEVPDASHPTAPDSIERRVAACTSCHGAHGIGSSEPTAAPRLAGQPAAYLRLQLAYFQSGQRKNDAMAYITRPLTPDYAKEIAEYFASQSMIYHPTQHAEPMDAATRRGEQLVLRGDPSRGIAPCASCHGAHLAGRAPQIPGITGLSREYVSAQFAQWRAHSRAADRPYCMSVVANRLSESDTHAVAAWLAGRTPDDVTPDASLANDPPLPEWCVLDRVDGGL